MRKKESLHERNQKMYASGEWASGNKWATDAPKDLIKAETLSVISLGACGAFVHGLEDEFLEVVGASFMSDGLFRLSWPVSCFSFRSVAMIIDRVSNYRPSRITLFPKLRDSWPFPE